mmetsp:Transcript_15112/g.31746  ORF Transcript_15112/g.31746 Transcript_15112/m.31746 type:complete len:242 (-) Transcript_15112:1210-1935(-)
MKSAAQGILTCSPPEMNYVQLMLRWSGRAGFACLKGFPLLKHLTMLFAGFPFVGTVDTKFHIEFIRGLDERVIEEPFGCECLPRRPSLLRVVRKQVVNKVNCMRCHPIHSIGRKTTLQLLAEPSRKGFTPILGLKVLPKRAHPVNVRPILGSRMTHGTENEIELIRFIRPFQQSPATEHLGNNASDTPHINFCRILNTSKEKLRWAVPQGNNAVGETFHFAIPTSRQTPIRNFKLSPPIDE